MSGFHKGYNNARRGIKETMLLLSIKIILLSIDKRDHATINEGHDYSIYFIKTNELISKLRDNAALDS